MRACALLALATLVASAAAAGTVIDATDATFDEVVKGDFVLMEFYAPWCGHCKKLEPEYTKAAEELGDLAVLAKLDATKETVSGQKFQIQGFPTIKIFRDGVVSGDYNGGRTAADIVKFVKGNVGPAVKAVATAEELETVKSQSNVAAVIFLDTVGGDKYSAFESAAKKLRADMTFAIVTDAGVRSSEGASEGSIVVYKKFDAPKEEFSGDATSEEAITTYLKSVSVPLFDEIGPHNYKMYLERALPLVWIFTPPKDDATLAAGRDVAPKFKGTMSFVWVDSSKYGGMAQRLGLSGDKFPAVAIDHSGKHFAMPDGEITGETLSAFVDQFAKGELKPTVRSEAAPEEHTVEGLTTVVGSTFQSLVEEADTDVFIEFYAPWCGHCKQLAPAYEAVAKELKDKPVRVAKIDATANDFPQDKFAVQGFPTMFFVPKATRKPEQYEGGRTQEAMVEFLEGKLVA